MYVALFQLRDKELMMFEVSQNSICQGSNSPLEKMMRRTSKFGNNMMTTRFFVSYGVLMNLEIPNLDVPIDVSIFCFRKHIYHLGAC